MHIQLNFDFNRTFFRQLLSGVENLRMIAATIDNQEQNPLSDPPNYLSDSDDNEFIAEGPAL